ncbi:MAG: cytochrome c3 family protein [Acidobacteriota bacterium]
MTNDKSKNLKLGLTILFCLMMVAACRSTQKNLNQPAEPQTPVQTPPQATGYVQEAKFIAPGSQSTYDHFRDGHKQLTDCNECHKRDTANPRATVANQPAKTYWQPYHDACNRCHKTDREKYNLTEAGATKDNPFCAACHLDPVVTVTADQTFKARLIDYPTRNQEFGTRGGLKGFSHKTHMDAQKMSGEGAEVSCGNCHNVKSNPTRATFPRHAECYQCHTHQAGEKLGGCGVCHVQKSEAIIYSPGMGSAASFNFRHSPSHLKSGCERCHRLGEPQEEARLDVQQINTARGQRHRSACWTCHAPKREAVCSKCHRSAIPF